MRDDASARQAGTKNLTPRRQGFGLEVISDLADAVLENCLSKID
jgi:hypothetical protein